MVSLVASKTGIGWKESDDELESLVGRIALGDERALARLYDVTSRFVYGLTLRITRDVSSAEELTLEVYMQVWRTAGSYSSERGKVSVWLLMLARSRGIDWLRSRRGRDLRVEQPLEDLNTLRDVGDNPETTLLGSERARAVRNAMQKMPPEQRHALELAYFYGMSHHDIAANSGLPLGTVKSRIRLGMMFLRQALDLRAEAI